MSGYTTMERWKTRGGVPAWPTSAVLDTVGRLGYGLVVLSSDCQGRPLAVGRRLVLQDEEVNLVFCQAVDDRTLLVRREPCEAGDEEVLLAIRRLLVNDHLARRCGD